MKNVLLNHLFTPLRLFKNLGFWGLPQAGGSQCEAKCGNLIYFSFCGGMLTCCESWSRSVAEQRAELENQIGAVEEVGWLEPLPKLSQTVVSNKAVTLVMASVYSVSLVLVVRNHFHSQSRLWNLLELVVCSTT
eukprot:3302652-Amphidinium_carterae.1